MKKQQKSPKSKKLSLSKEALRALTLTREQLGKVAGGYPSHGTISK